MSTNFKYINTYTGAMPTSEIYLYSGSIIRYARLHGGASYDGRYLWFPNPFYLYSDIENDQFRLFSYLNDIDIVYVCIDVDLRYLPHTKSILFQDDLDRYVKLSFPICFGEDGIHYIKR